jgi:hypothetical protein
MRIAILAAIALAVLAPAAYFGNEYRVCSNLETDLLNSASSIRGTSAMRSVLGNNASHTIDQTEAASWSTYETTLETMWDRCGERSAKTAARKAENIIAGLVAD